MTNYLMRWVPLAIAIGSVLLVSGCGACTGRVCAPAASSSEASEAAVGGPATEIRLGTTAEVVDPSSLTVGIVLAEIKELVGQLGSLVSQVGGEMKSVIVAAQASSSQLIAELDATFAGRYDTLVRDLTDQETRMVEDSLSVIDHLERSIINVEHGAAIAARESLYETDIAAYNALYSLPCRDREPRLLYARPHQFRIWREADKPIPPEHVGSTRQELALRARGNFLAFERPGVTVRVGAGTPFPAEVVSFNPNEIGIIVRGEAINELQRIAYPTDLSINARLATCTDRRDSGLGSHVESSAGIRVLPPLTYALTIVTRPTAALPSFAGRRDTFEETGSNRCDDNYRVDKIYSVGPPAEVTDWNVTTYKANCGSGINSVYPAGPYSVKVDAQIRGCGRDCVIGICNCKGRGWLGYHLDTRYKNYVQSALLESVSSFDTAQPSYVARYPFEIPTDKRTMICDYYGRLVVREGDAQRTIEFTRTNPNVEIVRSRVNNDTCEVNVEVDEPSRIMARRLGVVG